MKILIVRFSSIGDIILTTPVIRCLKKQVKNAEIHYLTKASFAGLLEHNPNIDKVWGLNDNFKELLVALKKEKFEYVIDLHNNMRTKRVTLNLGVNKSRLNKLNWGKWWLVQTKKDILPDIHIVDRYLAVARHFNIKNDDQGLDFFLPEETKIDVKLPANFVCYAIGGQHATKKMPKSKIVELCASMDKDMVLIGGKEDAAIGKEIGRQSQNVINLCGALSINQSALVIKKSTIVISHDTGMMHIAAALKKKVVSIWGNTVPKFGMYPYKPGDGSALFEVPELSCRPCSKIGYNACPKGHFDCMNKQDI
ncbi:MAG: ADP-heptose:LPS heptosyltransferase, partial [Bacteroidia bacterium]